MIIIEDQKSESSDFEPFRGSLDGSTSDLPPAYDTLSLHHVLSLRRSANHDVTQYTSLSTIPSNLVAGSSGDLPDSDLAHPSPPTLNVDKSLPPPPSLGHTPSPWTNASHTLTQRPRARKNNSWLSLLPFVSSFSAKRVRQSILSIVNDLVVPPSHTSKEEQRNVYEILASVAETCTEHKVCLSTILQEAFIADHTPMYWAIVNYRQELLVALLVHARPLSIQTVSDIRRACLVNSNQALFHALRVCRPPFHRTDGIQVPSLRTASDNLLLGHRPLDEIHIQRVGDQAFVISFVIPLWQRRMKAIGQVSIEFITSSRMWSVTFFSTDPSAPTATSGKLRKGTNTWHVMISLMESSPPTFFDSQLVVDVPHSLVPEPIQAPRLREARSTMFRSSCDKQYQSPLSMYDYDYDGKSSLRSSRDYNTYSPSQESKYSSSSLVNRPPPTHPLRGSSSSSRSSTATPPSISIRLGCGNRKLGRRAGTGEPMESPTTKPETWSDHGVGYTNVVVSPLGEGLSCQLLNDDSPYLLSDGTLRGRLEARLVKTESSKDCVIC